MDNETKKKITEQEQGAFENFQSAYEGWIDTGCDLYISVTNKPSAWRLFWMRFFLGWRWNDS